MLLICMTAGMRAIVGNDCFLRSLTPKGSKPRRLSVLKKARQSSRIEKSARPELVEACKALKALPVSAAILDNSGRILAVNDTWREFARANGLCLPNEGIGADYLQYCADSQFKADLKAFLAGRRDLLTLVYPCHSPSGKRWFSLIGVPLSLGKPGGVALLHVNL